MFEFVAWVASLPMLGVRIMLPLLYIRPLISAARQLDWPYAPLLATSILLQGVASIWVCPGASVHDPHTTCCTA